jgi:lipoprotein NlpD
MLRGWVLLATLVLAGCAAKAPAPVAESRPAVRVETGKSALPAAAAEGKVHVVKKGDTLRGIAREYGLNGQEIAAWNTLEDPNRIVPGQRLRLTPPSGQAVETGKIAESVEVQPIAASGGLVARPLDAAPSAANGPATRPPDAVTPAPSLSPANSETLKRTPKGGKLPYSEENLALLKGQTAAPPLVTAAAAASPPPPAPVAPVPAPAPTLAPAPPPPPDRSSAPPLATGVEWGWPAAGRLLATYSEGAGTQGLNRGVDIAGNLGDPVLAAAAGKVIFVGVYPKHGNLVVLLHAESYSSVYAHTQRILVKEGETVRRGQRIANLGNSDADQPKLHFEVRQQGKPVDPLRVLPPR